MGETKKFINATEAYEIWQKAGLHGTYPTFLALIKKFEFTIQPTRRVLLIKSDEFAQYVRTQVKKLKENINASKRTN